MLPAGKYYIGDLCYVIANWDAFCDMTIKENECLDGEFDFEGVKIASYGTAYGDGEYYDQYRGAYSVDAGLIGCMPVESLTKPFDPRLGHIVEFHEPFETSTNDGVIYFGEFAIDTNC